MPVIVADVMFRCGCKSGRVFSIWHGVLPDGCNARLGVGESCDIRAMNDLRACLRDIVDMNANFGHHKRAQLQIRYLDPQSSLDR